ncbi:hypothetical protein GXP71_00625 [Cellulomonas sp. H30R-01]|uniref:hypothetical protein n=1 Tax=Cellulomonas sp. H30R-01 TaxID=2704467 RepID=UPI00138D6C86|nr:hypothetical protein [Cellulomonas sp. H30R-01]QHT54748.1 hypothetical protein GXP71_00625 [Cellulomonas sp. H30R-01]
MTTPTTTAPEVRVRRPLLVGGAVTAVSLLGIAWVARDSLRRVLLPRPSDACPAMLPVPVSCMPEAHVLVAALTAGTVVVVLAVLAAVVRARFPAPVVRTVLAALTVVGALAVGYVAVWPFPTPTGWLPA